MATHAQEQQITLTGRPWTPAAEHWIAKAVRPDFLGNVRDQVEQGRSSLFHLEAGDMVVGAIVLRKDQSPVGIEGVIVAAAGQINGIDLTATCMPAIEVLLSDCQSIRYHTDHPAVARKLSSHGFHVDELICRKFIHG